MRHFVRIADGIDTLPLQLELTRNEALWDALPTRRLYDGTPHGAMTGIYARYMPEADLTDLAVRRREHRNVWWPAWHALPALRPLVFGLMARVQAVELGSVLLTRLPPGGEILPHSDAGSWAPTYYHCKAHVTVSGSAIVRVEDEQVRFEQGSIWTFDNLKMHAIANDGDVDRVVVIVSMRAE
jgi:mannose-6-phosphate isomerase-like protein (cupin superfamily)